MIRVVFGLKVVAVWLLLLVGVQSNGANLMGVPITPLQVTVNSETTTDSTYTILPGTNLDYSEFAVATPAIESETVQATEAQPHEFETEQVVSKPEVVQTTQVATKSVVPRAEVVAPVATVAPATVVTTPVRTPTPVVLGVERFSELIATIVSDTNQARNRDRSPSLTLSSSLSSAATKRSLDMARRGYFAHETPDGCDLECHSATIAFDANSWGENIAWYEPYYFLSETELGEHFVREWLKSSGHRRNMLNKDFTHQGIGVALAGEKIIVTVIFATAN